MPPEAGAAPTERGPGPAIQEAIGFLTARLRAGPVRLSVLRREAELRDPEISARSLYRAFEFMEGIEYEEENRKWWRLAENYVQNGQVEF